MAVKKGGGKKIITMKVEKDKDKIPACPCLVPGRVIQC